MEARVIPFPSRRRPVPAPAFAAGAAIAANPAAETRAVAFSELTFELRRVVHAGSPLAEWEEAELRQRCLNKAIDVLTESGAKNIRLEGTQLHPVVEARFEGDLACESAARSVVDAGGAVRAAGRNEFVASASVASGTYIEAHGGARVVFGATSILAAKLRENAAPGQILLGGSAWGDSPDIETFSAQSVSLAPGADPVPVFVLRDVR